MLHGLCGVASRVDAGGDDFIDAVGLSCGFFEQIVEGCGDVVGLTAKRVAGLNDVRGGDLQLRRYVFHEIARGGYGGHDVRLQFVGDRVQPVCKPPDGKVHSKQNSGLHQHAERSDCREDDVVNRW